MTQNQSAHVWTQLAPRTEAADTETPLERLLTPINQAEVVKLYLEKLHDRPHSLFHPATLKAQVCDGLLNRALLLAICSTGSRFSLELEMRQLESRLMSESKSLLLADLETICVENIQCCILIANLCAAHLNPKSEALFFRKEYLS